MAFATVACSGGPGRARVMPYGLSPEERHALMIIAEDGDALLFNLSLPRLTDLGMIEQTNGSFRLTDRGCEVLAQITREG